MALIFFAVAYTLGIVAGRAWLPPLAPSRRSMGQGSSRSSWPAARSPAGAPRRCGWGSPSAPRAMRSRCPRWMRATSPSTTITPRRPWCGWVAEEPGIRAEHTEIIVAATAIEGPAGETPVRGRLLARVPHHPALSYGDVVRLTGALETPPEEEGFSYREHLAARGALSWMPRADAQALGVRPGAAVALRRAAYRLKGSLWATIDAILPHPEAGLLSGILLGLGHTLPAEWLEAFRRVGLTHIIVISGYNISLVLTLFLLGRHVVRHQVALAAMLGSVPMPCSSASRPPGPARR